MFDIRTSKDFLNKLEEDFAEFEKNFGSSRLAINCILTAYHVHEWVWSDWLSKDIVIQQKLGVRALNKEPSFTNWVEDNCPDFEIIQDLANGSKHLGCRPHLRTEKFGPLPMPLGIIPVGTIFLWVRTPTGWKTAQQILGKALVFWQGFFADHYPS